MDVDVESTSASEELAAQLSNRIFFRLFERKKTNISDADAKLNITNGVGRQIIRNISSTGDLSLEL